MKKATFVTGFVSTMFVALLALGAGGCAGDAGDEETEEGLETTSDALTCKRVQETKTVAGRVITYSKVSCSNDGASPGGNGGGTKPPTQPRPSGDAGAGTATCTINGRAATCSDGVCRAVNGQPGPNCRFLD